MHDVMKLVLQAEEDARALRRKRLEGVLSLVRRWQADTSGYEERIWPDLKAQIELNRMSGRRRFRQQECSDA